MTVSIGQLTKSKKVRGAGRIGKSLLPFYSKHYSIVLSNSHPLSPILVQYIHAKTVTQ